MLPTRDTDIPYYVSFFAWQGETLLLAGGKLLAEADRNAQYSSLWLPHYIANEYRQHVSSKQGSYVLFLYILRSEVPCPGSFLCPITFHTASKQEEQSVKAFCKESWACWVQGSLFLGEHSPVVFKVFWKSSQDKQNGGPEGKALLLRPGRVLGLELQDLEL